MTQPSENAVGRFWARVDRRDDNECWPWLGSMHKANGYGMSPNRNLPGAYAHRIAYVLTHGPIAAGLVIDHLCRNRACCNPAHLEVVTRAENNRRGLRGRLRTHCAHGHEYTPENTALTREGRRSCRVCHRIRQRRRYHEKIGPRAYGRPGYTLNTPIEALS